MRKKNQNLIEPLATEKTLNNLIGRPPVVVVMGHVDHGKTSLLDYIRKTNVVEKESGGITQHIGAYEISHSGKRITFIDTPGHEAFSKMRSRGARVADVAILVVAADEGVKPQTKEAVSHIGEAKIPFLVAINKIDKPEANAEKVKQELASIGVLVEGWGGKIPVAEVSAKTGKGIDEMLDVLLLLAELEDLKADPSRPASGIVIEAHLDSRRGPTATLIILDGTLRKGDSIVAGSVSGKGKILENFRGESVESLSFSSPAKVIGWQSLALVGDEFSVGEDIGAKIEKPISESKPSAKESPSGARANLILKADVAGSREALEESIQKLAEEEGLEVKILESGVGDVSESDVKLSQATEGFIVGFKVKLSREADNLIRTSGVKVIQADIIYELLEALQKEFRDLIKSFEESKISGKLEVLAIFRSTGERQVIGGRVLEGKLVKGVEADIIRRGSKIAEGKIINLQLNRQDVIEVPEGNECGILFEAPIAMAKGDILEIKQ